MFLTFHEQLSFNTVRNEQPEYIWMIPVPGLSTSALFKAQAISEEVSYPE